MQDWQVNLHYILTARRYERLEALKAKILTEINPKAQIHIAQMDVTDSEQIAKTLASIPINVFGNPATNSLAIDVLINNAGLAVGVDPVESVTPEAYNRMMDTNVKGTLLMTQAILPIFRANNNTGQIVNIGSVAGTQAYANGSIYCASKHALNAITNALRQELVATNIRVCAINPGLVETEFSTVRFAGDKDKAQSVYAGIKALTGDDIAETIGFVVSRPDHVQVADILIYPNHQASVYSIHRHKE